MTLKVTMLEQEVDRLSSDGELESVSLPKKCKGKGVVEEVTEAMPSTKEAFPPLTSQILIDIVPSVYSGAQCTWQMSHISSLMTLFLYLLCLFTPDKLTSSACIWNKDFCMICV